MGWKIFYFVLDLWQVICLAHLKSWEYKYKTNTRQYKNKIVFKFKINRTRIKSYSAVRYRGKYRERLVISFKIKKV